MSEIDPQVVFLVELLCMSEQIKVLAGNVKSNGAL